ncbi:hypothetical protein [Methylobacterium sp. Leaf456]|uniref:hypothetical protein n=1 Tax=Methylobacterium sp. Leaf456 TaxID=1736382 RepID=UPI000B1318F3|nr:hypothetical protein [Methylobacterium sp. Leaf456]
MLRRKVRCDTSLCIAVKGQFVCNGMLDGAATGKDGPTYVAAGPKLENDELRRRSVAASIKNRNRGSAPALVGTNEIGRRR